MLLFSSTTIATSLAIQPVSSQASVFQSVKVLGIFAAASTPYDEPLAVKVLVFHDPRLLPEVNIFYMPVVKNRTLGTVWRISRGEILQEYPGLNETLYSATLPNPAFGDQLPAGTVIVYYVEATDASGSTLTSRENDRWNAYILDDKLTVLLIDTKPPSISNVTMISGTPVSGEAVSVYANVTDGLLGSGVSAVTISYSVDDGPFMSTPMTALEGVTYTGTIPPLQHDHTVTFFVTALDNEGNKADTQRFTYVVQRNAVEIAAENRVIQLYEVVGGSISLAVIVALVLWKRRQVVELLRGQAALSLGFLIAFLVAARVAFVLWSIYGLWWWNAIILIGLVEFWGLVDPRVQGTFKSLIMATLGFGKSLTAYLSRTFQENPPTILVAAAYVLGLTGAVCDVILLLFTRDLSYAYTLANFIAEYVFILLALGVIGQIILLSRKKDKHAEPVSTAT